MVYIHKMMESPVGNLKLVASEKGLAAILWEDDDPRRVRLSSGRKMRTHPVLLEAERQLKEYFDGNGSRSPSISISRGRSSRRRCGAPC